MTQCVAITGSSGLIGGALASALTARGDRVVRLVRSGPRSAAEVRWDPTSRHLDPVVLEDVDAVVNLAGAGIGDKRWSADRKREILTSRVDATYAVASAIAATGRPLRLVSGSAIGFYGDRGEEELTEDSPAGSGFTTEVVLAWEGATEPAQAAGAPTAYARSGIVLAPHGGAMERVLPLARLGLAGPLGSGRQWWPWITLADEVAALIHLIDHPEVTGPVNVVGPVPARQRDVMRALGKALRRPALLPAPRPALMVVLGEFAREVLDSHRVLPERLSANGFRWQQPDLGSAVGWLLDS